MVPDDSLGAPESTISEPGAGYDLVQFWPLSVTQRYAGNTGLEWLNTCDCVNTLYLVFEKRERRERSVALRDREGPELD